MPRANLEANLAEAIAWEQVKREGRWTEGLPVGSKRFVEQAQSGAAGLQTEIVETEQTLWVFKEAGARYVQKTASRTGCKTLQ